MAYFAPVSEADCFSHLVNGGAAAPHVRPCLDPPLNDVRLLKEPSPFFKTANITFIIKQNSNFIRTDGRRRETCERCLHHESNKKLSYRRETARQLCMST